MFGKLFLISIIFLFVFTIFDLAWDSYEYNKARNGYEIKSIHNKYFYIISGIGVSFIATFIFLILTILFW